MPNFDNKDYLLEAQKELYNAGAHEPEYANLRLQAAIAAALIALCQRIDRVTTTWTGSDGEEAAGLEVTGSILIVP